MTKWFVRIAVIGVALYSIVGTSYNVNYIKQNAPKQIEARNWTLIRCDGYKWGAWQINGGRVYYSVIDNNTKRQGQLFVSSWFGELQFWYDQDTFVFHSY